MTPEIEKIYYWNYRKWSQQYFTSIEGVKCSIDCNKVFNCNVIIRAIYTRRVVRQYGICWLKKELSMVHVTLHIFLGIKLFLFVKIESWNFQQLFDEGFCETLQNFSTFRQIFRWHFSRGNKSCPNELKICEVSQTKTCWKFQISILTNKKVIFLKKYLVYHLPWLALFQPTGGALTS